jgi:hypothetical protein
MEESNHGGHPGEQVSFSLEKLLHLGVNSLVSSVKFFLFCHRSTQQGGEVRAVVSKRGVDDGNQKGGGSFQPAKKSQFHYNKKIDFVNKFLKFFYFEIYLDITPGIL